MNLKQMQQAIVEALEDIKGFDITVLDVSKLTAITSCMIVSSANSSRQAISLAQHVQAKLKEKGATIYGIEGEKDGEWVLLDLGDIIVHVMLPTTRAYYNLEQLWGAAEDHRQTTNKSTKSAAGAA